MSELGTRWRHRESGAEGTIVANKGRGEHPYEVTIHPDGGPQPAGTPFPTGMNDVTLKRYAEPLVLTWDELHRAWVPADA